MRKFLLKSLAIVMCVILPFIAVGCGEDSTNLSFDDLSEVLLQFDGDVQPFLSSLEYKYQNHEDIDLLTASASLIQSVSKDMGDSFKSFNTIISEHESSGAEDMTVSRSSEEIQIVTVNADFVAKLSSDKKYMSIKNISGGKEYLIEIACREEGGYYVQIASSNSDGTFSLYQLRFKGNAGTLNIDAGATAYVSIYKADIDDSVFPSIQAIIFNND